MALGLLACWLAVPAAFAQAPDVGLKRCTQVTVVSDADGGSETLTDLSDTRAVVCSVDFVPTRANGLVRLVDSPDDTITHGQARTVAEASSDAANKSAHAYYGELGRLTHFGLEAEVSGGYAVIHWDD